LIPTQKLLIQTLQANGSLKKGEFEGVLADFLRTLPDDLLQDQMYEPHRMLLAKLSE
jgi:hypothetical protein